jgi:soluble lytic murein transglycosylase-like protein
MRRITAYSVSLVLALTIVLWMSNKATDAEANKYNNNKIQYVVSVVDSPLMIEAARYKFKLEQEKIHSEEKLNKRYEIKDVNLNKNLLDFIWNEANDNDIAYTLILAIAKQESNLNQDRINHNSNGTFDSGLMQINSRSVKWLAELADIKNPNPKNDYHSTKMAIAYLVEERDYWRQLGLSEEHVFFATLLTYNRGRAGATSYIRKNGWNSKYVENVLNYKGEFEQNIIGSD